MSAVRNSLASAFDGASERILEGLAGVEFRARLSVPLTQGLIELLEHRRAARAGAGELAIVAYRANASVPSAQPSGAAAGPSLGTHPNGRMDGSGAARPRRAVVTRLRYPLIVGAVLLCVGGAATASSLWLAPAGNPVYGFNPGLSSSAPPAAQLDALAVLRRPQTDAERATDVLGALADVNIFTKGLRSDYVRVLEQTAAGPIVLIPVQTRDGTNAGPAARPAIRDALCVYYPTGGSGSLYASTPCWTTAQLMAGGALAGNANHEYGLVPDGVRSVHVVLGTWERSVAVVGNFFDVTLPAGGGTSGAPTGVPISPTITFSRAAA